MACSSVFYYYTSRQRLKRILVTETILPSLPHPATPGILGGSNVKDGAVFLTRMDPTNSKRAIAFNNNRCKRSKLQISHLHILYVLKVLDTVLKIIF